MTPECSASRLGWPDDVKRESRQQLAPAIGARAAAERVAALAEARKYGYTVQYQQENPKRKNSSVYERYEKYKAATTVQEAHDRGATKQDVAYDYDKGFFNIL